MTGLIHSGDVVCMGDTSMVLSASYPWKVMWMGDAWWLIDVVQSGNVV